MLFIKYFLLRKLIFSIIMIHIKKKIVSLIENVGNHDTKLLINIFNILTDNNINKNYSNNKSGILFNLDKFSDDKILLIEKVLDAHFSSLDTLNDIEEERIKNMTVVIDTSYKNDIKNYIRSEEQSTIISNEVKIKTPKKKLGLGLGKGKGKGKGKVDIKPIVHVVPKSLKKIDAIISKKSMVPPKRVKKEVEDVDEDEDVDVTVKSDDDEPESEAELLESISDKDIDNKKIIMSKGKIHELFGSDSDSD